MSTAPRPTDPTGDAAPSRATALRLSHYLRELAPRARAGGSVSSGELARSVSVSAAQVRRDLAVLGHLGQRGVGYDSRGLAGAIRQALGVDRPYSAVLVGVGNLARALLKSQAFNSGGLTVIALFDSDPAKVGQTVEGLLVESADHLARRARQLGVEMAVLTAPAAPAQRIADALVSAGVAGIMNFAPVNLEVPRGVQVVSVDLTAQFEQLAFLVRQRERG